MLVEPCTERQRLMDDLSCCQQSHRDSVRAVRASGGMAEKFDIAFDKSMLLLAALQHARDLLRDHVSEHRC